MLVTIAHGLQAGQHLNVLPALAAIMLADGRATLWQDGAAAAGEGDVHALPAITPAGVVSTRDPRVTRHRGRTR